MALEPLYEGYKIAINPGTFAATIIYKCPWDEVPDVVGYGTTGGGLYGDPHPDYPDFLCTSIDIVPLGDADSLVGGPETAKVTAIYTDQNYDTKGGSDQYIETRVWGFDVGGEARSVGVGYQYDNGADWVKIKDEPGSFIREPRIQATMNWAPAPSIVQPGLRIAFFTEAGKINSAQVSCDALVCAIHTLMYVGATITQQKRADGTTFWLYQAKFIYNPNKWDYMYIPQLGSYAEVQLLTGGDIYEESAFTGII